MLINFFHGLRDAGVPVTIRELLDLMEGLKRHVAFGSMDEFYYFSRTCMAMNTDIPSNNRIRKIIARISPIFRALACSSRGNRLAAIVINMMLSMPKTISKKVSVSKATQISGLAKSGIAIKSVVVISKWSVF